MKVKDYSTSLHISDAVGAFLREVLRDPDLTDEERVAKALEVVEKPWHWEEECIAADRKEYSDDRRWVTEDHIGRAYYKHCRNCNKPLLPYTPEAHDETPYYEGCCSEVCMMQIPFPPDLRLLDDVLDSVRKCGPDTPHAWAHEVFDTLRDHAACSFHGDSQRLYNSLDRLDETYWDWAAHERKQRELLGGLTDQLDWARDELKTKPAPLDIDNDKEKTDADG